MSEKYAKECDLQNFFDEDEIIMIRNHWCNGYTSAIKNFTKECENTGTKTGVYKYKCDRCLSEHELDESKVKDKQYYISPSSCYEGDYYVHAYFWFECDCGRAIKVKEEHLSHPLKIEKEYSEHKGVCPY